MEQFEIVLFSVSLIFFSGWFMYLTNHLRGALASLEDSDDRIDEISESVEVVVQILQRLPDLMPQLHAHTSPLQPLMEAFAARFMGAEPIKAVEPPRDTSGQYATTQKEE